MNSMLLAGQVRRMLWPIIRKRHELYLLPRVHALQELTQSTITGTGYSLALASGVRSFEEVARHEAAHMAAHVLQEQATPTHIEMKRIGRGYVGSMWVSEMKFMTPEAQLAPAVLDVGYHLSQRDLDVALHFAKGDIIGPLAWLQDRREPIQQMSEEITSHLIPDLEYVCYHFSIGGGKWIFEGAHDPNLLVVRSN